MLDLYITPPPKLWGAMSLLRLSLRQRGRGIVDPQDDTGSALQKRGRKADALGRFARSVVAADVREATPLPLDRVAARRRSSRRLLRFLVADVCGPIVPGQIKKKHANQRPKGNHQDGESQAETPHDLEPSFSAKPS